MQISILPVKSNQKLLKIVLNAILLAMIFGNLIQMNSWFKTTPTRQQRLDNFAGLKFKGLENILNNATMIGYITDRNMDDSSVVAQFTQAQYALAPIILNIEHPLQRYIIIDCSSEQAALAVMTSIHAKPIKKNQFGVILAERTN